MNQEVNSLADILNALRTLPPQDHCNLEFPLPTESEACPSLEAVEAYCQANSITESHTVRITQHEGLTPEGEPGIGFTSDLMITLSGKIAALIPLMEAVVEGTPLPTPGPELDF